MVRETLWTARIIFIASGLLATVRSEWDIAAERPKRCPPIWKGVHHDYTSCSPSLGYFYMTGCKSVEPGPEVNLHGRLTVQVETIEDCAFKCYHWRWNDLDCQYFREPGCAGFDWYPITGTCVMWTEICDNASPQCPYPWCENVYHFNRFDCFFSKDWGAFHLHEDPTQRLECPPLFPSGLACTDGNQCSCIEHPPTFNIVCAENCGIKASPDLSLRLQINCTSCKLSEVYGYEWSINTHIDWATQSDTGRHFLGMAIDADVLKGNSDYAVSARVRRIMPEGPCVEKAEFATYTVKMASLPVTGYCKAAPLVGVALLDEFQISCRNFSTDVASDSTYFMYLCDNATDTACKNKLLYEGTNEIFPPTTLPTGDPNYEYRIVLKITVADDFGGKGHFCLNISVNPIGDINQEGGNTALFDVLKNLTVGGEGGNSKLQGLLADSNAQAALSVALNSATVLNDATGSLSEDQQQELRSGLVSILGAVNVTNTNVAQKQVQTLTEISKGGLSENATSNAVSLYGNLGGFLEQRATQSSSSDVDIEHLEETAELVLYGSMKILNSTDKSSSLTNFNSTDVQKVKNIAKSTLGVLGGVVKALLKRKVAGDIPAVYETDALTLKVEKVDASILKVASFNTPGGGKFDIPGVDSLLSGRVGSDNAVLDVQMTQAGDNQYVWDPSAALVLSDVVSLDVNLGVGEKLPTDGLVDPIKICVPTAELKKETKSAKTNLAFASSIVSKSILVYNMTIAVDDQLVKLRMEPSSLEHTFLVVVTTDQVPTHDDFYRAGNASVKLLICITDGQPVNETIGVRCDSPGGINDTTNFGFLFNGSQITIVARNVEEPTEDVSIHVGSIAVILDSATGAKASALKGHRAKRSSEPPEEEQVFQVCEEELPRGRGRVTLSPKGPLVVFDTTALTCTYWNETTDKWSTEGCSVAFDSDSDQLECNCTHLSSFGGKMIVAPNAVDPIGDFALFATFFENPVSVVMVVVMWILFALIGVRARRSDKADLARRGVTLLEDNHPRDTYVYLVTVITGWRDNAGTTSTVGMYITGQDGKSERHILVDPNKKTFMTGGEDWFLLTTRESLGELESVDVWLDFTGVYPPWYLQEIIIRDLRGKQLWIFEHGAWIYPDKNFKTSTATIKAQRPTEKREIKKSNQFEMRTSQDLRDKHLWVSIFSVSPYSNFTRMQRLTCAFTFIFLAMLTNMMFYGVVPDDDTSGDLGGFSFNYGQIIIAIESSLITVPINASLIWIFRNARLKPSQKKTVADKVREGVQKARSLQKLAAQLSEESLTHKEMKSIKVEIHHALLDLAKQMNLEADDNFSNLSKISSDSSEFVMSSDSELSQGAQSIGKLLRDIGINEPLEEETEKKLTKHFGEVTDATLYPQEERGSIPDDKGLYFANPLTKGWVNMYDMDDLASLLADVESRLPDDLTSESSMSNLSSTPSILLDLAVQENKNQSNRADDQPSVPKQTIQSPRSAHTVLRHRFQVVDETAADAPSQASQSSECGRRKSTHAYVENISNSAQSSAMNTNNNVISRKRISIRGCVEDGDSDLSSNEEVGDLQYDPVIDEAQGTADDVKDHKEDEGKSHSDAPEDENEEKSHSDAPEDENEEKSHPDAPEDERPSRRRGLCFCCARKKNVKDSGQDASKEKKKMKNSGLPWWTIKIAWTLSVLTNVVASYFIMLYGLQFGYSKSIEWLTAFFISFFGSTVVVQPLKILAVAAIFSYIMKTPLNVDYDSANLTNPELEQDEEYQASDAKARKNVVIRTDPRYFPPTEENIVAVNRQLDKETKMKGFLKDLAFLFVFTITITIIVYLHIPGETYFVTKNAKDSLVESHYADGTTVEDVRLEDDIWSYLHTTLLPSVYNVPDDETDNAQFYLPDLATIVIGVPRIRQLRVDHGDCELPANVRYVSAECFREYSSSNEERGDYNVAWSPLFENSTIEPNSAWVYNSAFKLETTPIFAAHETYGGGGYVALLKSNQNNSAAFLNYWQENRWIDRYTRAVIVELNTFHPPSHLFSATAIVFEAHASGAFTPYVQVLTSKLYFYSDPSELSAIAFEINFIILTIVMTIRELWKGCKQRKKYFQDPWNFIELLIIGLSYAVLILYMQRIFLISRTLRKYKTGKCRNVFVSFYPAVLADHTLQYVMAALITAASVRYVKFLNLNKRVLVISMAIKMAFSTVVTYACIMVAAIIMFSAAGVLVLGPFCAEMNSPVEAAVSIFFLVLMDTQFEMEECLASDITRLKGPIYIMVIGFAVIMIGVPLLQSILDYAIVSTRRDRDKLKEEYEVLDFVYYRLRYLIKKS